MIRTGRSSALRLQQAAPLRRRRLRQRGRRRRRNYSTELNRMHVLNILFSVPIGVLEGNEGFGSRGKFDSICLADSLFLL